MLVSGRYIGKYYCHVWSMENCCLHVPQPPIVQRLQADVTKRQSSTQITIEISQDYLSTTAYYIVVELSNNLDRF